MPQLRRRFPDTELVIAGGETLFDYRDYRAAVLARAAELDLRPQILGPVPHEQLPALVAAAGVFALPSVQEGFGLAAMEALEVPDPGLTECGAALAARHTSAAAAQAHLTLYR
ncbi:MAG: glycosyltransferase [Pseudonocardiaceae bacterium]